MLPGVNPTRRRCTCTEKLSEGSSPSRWRSMSRPDASSASSDPNGAGKTTLLRIVAGSPLSPMEGCGSATLVLDDAGTDTFLPVEQRPVSVVFQDYRLFPHLSVLDNVAFASRSRGTRSVPARHAAGYWLRRLDLADLADRRAARRSPAARPQRVALARALAASPQILLLDERWPHSMRRPDSTYAASSAVTSPSSPASACWSPMTRSRR